ncbi:hypothetical protein QCA50_008653 [Cerrena zonata]|uniref:Uncharacterized protein n=1 Tax=Cerrena zonata TaxID=2478898 RepID=A0AAW0G3K8_9APHY
MAKTKPSTYNFSPAQCVHLEAVLTEYIQFVKDEDVDGCDQVIVEVTATLCTEAGIHDDTKKESVTASVRQWLNIKSSQVKRSRVVKFFELTGVQCFHTDKWESKIKPLVVAKFPGPNPNKQKNWLKEVMLARDALWAELEDDERTAYELRAVEINEGSAAKDMKALYGDKHFEEELQKVINHFNKVFDARIIAVTVHVGTKGTMSSILEPKGPSRFLKTLPDGKMYNWTPADYVMKMKAELRPSDGNSSDDDTLRLRFGPDKRPIFPRGPYDRQGEDLRDLLAEYVRWHYNKIRVNHKKDIGPPWKSMTGLWSEYIDPEYFPSQAGLEEHVDLATYRLQKVFRMPLSLVVAWAELIVRRQDARANGELGPDEEIFTWKVYLSDSSRWIAAGEVDTEREATKKRRRRTKATKTNKKQRTSDDGSEQEVDAGLIHLDTPVDFGEARDGETPGPDTLGAARKQKGRVMKGSPASVSEEWSAQVQYLRELCDDINYQNIVRWLGTSQNQSDLANEVIPRGAPHFGALGWDNPLSSLPEVIHVSGNAKTMVDAFLTLWEKNYQMLWNVTGSVEELALIGGQLIRDIRVSQFAQGDSEDPWPAHLPYYLCDSSFSVQTENRISDVCQKTWESMCFAAQMQLAQGFDWSMDLMGSQASGSQVDGSLTSFAAYAFPGSDLFGDGEDSTALRASGVLLTSNTTNSSHPEETSGATKESGHFIVTGSTIALPNTQPAPAAEISTPPTALRVPKARQPPRKPRQKPSGIVNSAAATVEQSSTSAMNSNIVRLDSPQISLPVPNEVNHKMVIPDRDQIRTPDGLDPVSSTVANSDGTQPRQLRTKKKITWRKDGTQVTKDADHLPINKPTNVKTKTTKVNKPLSRK